MERATQPPLHKQVSSVIEVTYQKCGVMPMCLAFCHRLDQQFAGGEPDLAEDRVATL